MKNTTKELNRKISEQIKCLTKHKVRLFSEIIKLAKKKNIGQLNTEIANLNDVDSQIYALECFKEV